MILVGDIRISDYIKYLEVGELTYRMHSAMLMKHYKQLCPLNDIRIKHILRQYELYDSINSIVFSEEAKQINIVSIFLNITHMNNYIANYIEIPDFILNKTIPIGGPYNGTLYDFLEMGESELDSYSKIGILTKNLRYLRLINIHGLYTETHIANLNSIIKYVYGCEEMLDLCAIAGSRKLFADYKILEKK
jgi:hypothetical protein